METTEVKIKKMSEKRKSNSFIWGGVVDIWRMAGGGVGLA